MKEETEMLLQRLEELPENLMKLKLMNLWMMKTIAITTITTVSAYSRKTLAKDAGLLTKRLPFVILMETVLAQNVCFNISCKMEKERIF